MKQLSKNICIGLLGICFLITSPLITWAVMKQSPDTRAAETPSIPSDQPENQDIQESADQSSEIDPDDSASELLEVKIEFIESDASYFDDALMIGDSRMEDIQNYGTLDNADFLIISEGESLEENFPENDYSKIYIMPGQNEGTPESFRINMTQLIEEVKQYAPDALIFLMANLHVSRQAESESNEQINTLNHIMEEMCNSENIFYLDVNPLFDDDEGFLSAEASGDGVHLYAAYYPQWCDWLLEHTITPQSRLASMPEFHFGQAIQELRKGHHVSRKSWENENIWLELIDSDEDASIQMNTAENKKLRWSASQEDMLAEDWFIVQ